MSLLEIEPQGQDINTTISVGMVVRECFEVGGPPLHLFIDGVDSGVFDWEMCSMSKIGSVDYIEAEETLRSKCLVNMAEWIIANCMQSINPTIEIVEFHDRNEMLFAAA